jgi:NADH:ubiquinone oxidoreductase subunit F (NADH-binding)
VIAVLSDQACPVSETARRARWLAGQSARQCGPCLHGLDTIAATIEALAGGAVHEPAGRRLEQLGRLTAGRGACGHPDGSVRVLISALRLFWDEVQDHVRHGRCDACALAPELPFPARTVDASRRAGARTRR